jgi:hypothetical protein
MRNDFSSDSSENIVHQIEAQGNRGIGAPHQIVEGYYGARWSSWSKYGER